MSAITTTENDVKERLSFAYLTAVAARAGCQVMHPPIDRKSIDAVVEPIKGAGVRVDFQLKATSSLTMTEDHCVYSLPINNYDDLRDTEIESARLLAVIDLSNDPTNWLRVDEESLLMNRCGYWLNLHGSPPSPNETSVTVYLPRSQLLTPTALQDIMGRRLQRLRDGAGGL